MTTLCACGEPSRYRCPACDARSCSLACVNKHKAERACSGVREVSTYRSIQKFDDALLVRDYRFLEGVARGVDSGKRGLRETERPAMTTRDSGLTPGRQNLLRQARERGVQLELLPHGMRRQRENTTRYDARRQSIGWRVELRFVDEGVLHVVPCVPEGCTLLQLLRSCLEPNVSLTPQAAATSSDAGASAAGAASSAGDSASTACAPTPPAAQPHAGVSAGSSADAASTSEQQVPSSSTAAAAAPAPQPPRRDEGQRALLRHKLRAYTRAGVPALRAYMLAECRRADDNRYLLLPLAATVRDALRGKAVIEFPILHIALPGNPGEDSRFPLLQSALAR